MRYELFRLSLMANTRPPLLEIIQPSSTSRVERQVFLQDEFLGRVDFLHRGRDFSYVYVDSFDGIIVARIGRLGLEGASSDPDHKFEPKIDERFQAVNVYLDTASDPNGQKIAMQHDQRIGKPGGILESLLDHINTRVADQPYEIALHPIVSESDFWTIVKANERDITSLRIDLSAPNVLGLGASIPKEMKAAKDENNVSKATVILENKHGIKVDTIDIRETIKYVLAGGGDAILNAGKRILFSTRRRRDSVNVGQDEPVSINRRDMAREVSKKIFGR